MSSYWFDRQGPLVQTNTTLETIPHSAHRQYFSLGRMALTWALQGLENLRPGDAVLIPLPLCHSAFAPLKQKGLQLVPYELTSHYRANFDDLRTKAESTKAKALLWVHYFGLVEGLEQVLEWAQKKNIFFIEDNAHGHGGLWQGQPLGQFGDIGIHSLRKSYPIFDGALLDSQLPLPIPSFATQALSACAQKKIFLRQNLKRQLLSRDKFRPLFWKRRWRSYENPTVNEGISESMPEMNRLAYTWWNQQNPMDLAKKRRELYCQWTELLSIQQLAPLWNPKELDQMAPLVCPVLLESKIQRDHWLQSLFKQGVDAYPWPEVNELTGQSSHALDLQNRLVCLPINPWWPTSQVDGLFHELRTKWKL